jgi:hypothetical protein
MSTLGATAANFSAFAREMGSTVEDPETNREPVMSGSTEAPPPPPGDGLALVHAARTNNPPTANKSVGRSRDVWWVNGSPPCKIGRGSGRGTHTRQIVREGV